MNPLKEILYHWKRGVKKAIALVRSIDLSLQREENSSKTILTTKALREGMERYSYDQSDLLFYRGLFEHVI